MVATAVARLAGSAQLSLDDPVAAHVPELLPVTLSCSTAEAER